ncbi:MarR family winged helix-turn-helix transcriptional regulator [Egicoccus sp. AB-alg6-2]|uniref:MarR family winged helix-turn-helix transcriptional regulator n=1 Tax=Egicoccus sp. AB-alg6-2 TaxID=3242692 RepID=UPI00359D67AC
MSTDTAPAATGHARIPAQRLAAWRAFLEAHARVTDVLGRELREQVQLPLAWYDVLVHLQEADGHRLRMQELAEAVLLSKSGLTRLVDRMESEGLVQRAACPDDRRGTFAELTPQGLQMLRSTAPTHLRGVDEHFTSLLEDDEVEVLIRALDRIASRARGTDTTA